jgi:hypothetical protein
MDRGAVLSCEARQNFRDLKGFSVWGFKFQISNFKFEMDRGAVSFLQSPTKGTRLKFGFQISNFKFEIRLNI